MGVIIKRKSDNVVTWFFDCSLEEVQIKKDKTIAPGVVIMDMKTSTAEKIEVESIPEDFVGCKYLYVNSEFELNPDWGA